MPPGSLFQSIERDISRPKAQRSEQRQQGKDVASRKLILRAFAAADEFKSARSLARSVRLKAQTKLIADPEGGSKPAGKPAALPVSEAVENAAFD